jgi:ATP-dependent helicase HrpA
VATRFPDTLDVNGVAVPLAYRYAPGDDDDGATLELPLAMLGQLEERHIDRLVPGWLEDKVTALVRGLPKAVRRALVPAPAVAGELIAHGLDASRSLAEALSRAARATRGLDIAPDAWRAVELPPELRINVRVRGGDGRALAQGRDIDALRRQLGAAAAGEAARAESGDWPAREIRGFDFGRIPEAVRVPRGDGAVVLYPALRDRGVVVEAMLADSAEAARALTRAGVLRLAAFALDRELRYLKRHTPGVEALAAALKPLGNAESWREDLADAALSAVVRPDDTELRDAATLQARCSAAKDALIATATALADEAVEIADAWQCAHQAASRLAPGPLRDDVRAQLDGLVYRGFIAGTPASQFGHLVRYLRGIALRIEKARNAPDRDRSKAAELVPWLARIEALRAGRSDAALPADVAELRWLVEEFRISLFAQELKTAVPVSTQRLARAFESVSGPGARNPAPGL